VYLREVPQKSAFTVSTHPETGQNKNVVKLALYIHQIGKMAGV
jgi:hypothetical protein